MKLIDIYHTAVRMGIANDPRGEEVVKKELQKNQAAYEKLAAAAQHQPEDAIAQKELALFDQNCLFNPYSDTRLMLGEAEQEITSVMMGIDMEIGEVLLADRLRERGKTIDLLISHHPEGVALAALTGVMHLHSDLMSQAGVLPNVARSIMTDRIQMIDRSIAVSNQQRTIQAAALLDFPFLSVHTPADNMVTKFVETHLDKAAPDTVGDVLHALEEIPEYRTAAEHKNRATAVAGDKDSPCGKIYVDFTGGTSGSSENYKRLAEAGISTVIAMHCTEEHLKVAKEHYLNVVVASHMGSDSIGCNLFLDALERQGVAILPVSGLIRVSRNA